MNIMKVITNYLGYYSASRFPYGREKEKIREVFRVHPVSSRKSGHPPALCKMLCWWKTPILLNFALVVKGAFI